jgi:TrmH family RNA methyltransferase
MADLKRNLHFVLVRPRFASNLGSTARVMSNMGLANLILVRPECEVGIEARSFAMKGADILDRARFFPSLGEVADELGLLIGTTGRFRGGRRKLIDPIELVEDVLPQLTGSPAGIVFGSEDNGLRRDELPLCQWLVKIPTAPAYPAINLAQAASIVAYQIHVACRAPSRRAGAAVDTAQLESMLERVENLLAALELPTRVPSARLMPRIRKIAARARLDREDVNMLHGLLRALDRRLKK